MERIDVSTILGRIGRLVAGDIATALVTLLLFAGIGTLSDISHTNTNAGVNIATVFAQYFVVRRLCERNGLMGAQRAGGFLGFFGLGLLAGLGVLVGFLLLVLPGIYLAARWSVGGVALIAERRGVTDALAESWRLTADHALVIALATVLLFVPAVAAIGITIAFSDHAGNLSVAASLFVNIALYSSLIAGWYLGVAVYTLLGSDRAKLVHIFE